MLAELRLAVRTLRRLPGFSLTVCLVLALGVGLTAVALSAVRAALWMPLPYRDAGRLVHVALVTRAGGELPASYPDFRDWRDATSSFEALAAYSRTNRTMTGAGAPLRLAVTQVTSGFFATLGVEPRGREFTPAQEQAGADRVTIVTDRFRRDHMGGRADAAGATVQLNGIAYTVVGVLPPSFRFDLDAPDLFIPLGLTEADETRRDSHWLGVIGRLRDGVTRSDADADLQAALRRSGSTADAAVVPLRDRIVGVMRPAFMALLGAVIFVMVAAVSAVANLVSARAVSRRSEFAVRVAIGATRAAVWRAMAAELMVLGAVAAACAMTIASLAIATVPSWMPAPLLARAHYLETMRHDTTAVSGSAVLCLAVLALASISAIPDVMRVGRGGWSDLAGSGRVAGGAVRRWAVGVQVAVAVVLLAGSALLTRSVERLLDVSLGFSTSQVSVARLSLPPDRYRTPDQVAAFYERVIAAAAELPGVVRAGIVDELPLTKDDGGIRVSAVDRQERPVDALVRSAGPGYFEAIGITLIDGRTFSAADTVARAPAVVLSRRLAALLFDGRGAVGRRVTFGRAQTYDVVGVVDDVRMGELDREFRPAVYTCALQDPSRSVFLVVRSPLTLAALVPALRERVLALDPEVPLYAPRTLGQVRSETRGLELRTAVLYPVGLFAALTLIVALLGVYGVLNYLLARRTREIGIRMALGATPADVLRGAMRYALSPVVSGVAAGLVIAVAGGRMAASLLYGVRTWEPLLLITVAVGTVALASATCLLPALRMARVDPVRALAAE